MSQGTIKMPFQQGYCDECFCYKTDEFGSRQCSVNRGIPVRKIKECEHYLHPKAAEFLDKEMRLINENKH